MAKRRITLTTQEMTEIDNRTRTLEQQLQRSNARVEELENGLGFIRKLITARSRPKEIKKLCSAVTELIDTTITPPVTAKLEAEALETAVNG